MSWRKKFRRGMNTQDMDLQDMGIGSKEFCCRVGGETGKLNLTGRREG